VVDKTTRQILQTSFCNGKKHDFRLLKESKVRFNITTELLVDTGYQGLQKLHQNTRIPKKKTKKNPLSKEDKQNNKLISSPRMLAEHVIREIKIFKITSERYRNRRKRFGLRFNLIAGLYNFELNL
jgi:predicted ATP-dependent serine protease